MFLLGNKVLHIVDIATNFCAAYLLRLKTTDQIWRTAQNLWTMAYIGPSDYLSVDKGSSYISQEMKENVEASGMTLKEAQIETKGAIGTVERYHAPLQAAFKKNLKYMKKDISENECLKMATFPVNCNIGPERL